VARSFMTGRALRSFIGPIACLSFGCTPEPAYPPPAGWVESCYGGSSERSLDRATPHLVVTLAIEKSQWPQLHEDLEALGRSLALDVFDSSLYLDHVEVFGMGLCSARGLFLHADGRDWLRGQFAGTYSGVRLDLYTHHNSDFEWRPVADALVELVQRKRADVAQVQWRDGQ